MSTRLPAVLLAATTLLFTGVRAEAHAHLKSATPAVNGTVAQPPTELDLGFSEGVNLKFTGVKVTGPAGAAVATGMPAFGPGGDTTLVVPVTGPLQPGPYRVEWHALATDGHKTEGAYSFTIRP